MYPAELSAHSQLSLDVSKGDKSMKDRKAEAFGHLWIARVVLTGFAMSLLLAGGAAAQQPNAFKDFKSYVAYVANNHKAPFDRDGSVIPTDKAKQFLEHQAKLRAANAAHPAVTPTFLNVKVNQDRNPWPKAEIGAAVDPSSSSWVVMTNDFRENYDKMFYHVSTDGGLTWTDDSMVGGNDPFTGFIPLTFQSDPGVSFDLAGNSYISTITGNLIIDFNNGYENVDTEIDLAQGFSHGTFTSLLPTPIDDQPCNGLFTGIFNCPAVLDKPLITTDTNPGSPNQGTTYVYYTLFCIFPDCTDGTATVPAFGSAILESHSAGPGQPFSLPALVSGPLTAAQFSDMVIDASGIPHVFFDDFSTFPFTQMWESTLKGGTWVVSSKPVASFIFNGLRNLNWAFRDSGAQAPGCGIHQHTAYCAFNANQIGNGKLEATPSLYLMTVVTGSNARITRVNNDTFNDQKEHFFGWATATPAGDVYVGWYDSRNDPFSTTVQYFVGKSTDGGKTFPTQQAVSDTAFNPCTGFPGCGFFGDYTQLVSGPDGTVHAAWTDTRDQASMQIWSQAITW
jgi:hypothetical protein